MVPGHHLVLDVLEAGVSVPPAGHLLLVVALGEVPLAPGRVVIVPERIGLVSRQISWARDLEPGVSHAHVELVVLEPPAPVLVAHAVDQLEVPRGDEQNAAHKGGVVVAGVQVRRRNVERMPVLRFAVGQLRVQRQQVDVVHGHVVDGAVDDLETGVDQAGPVEAVLVYLVEHDDLVVDGLVHQEVVHVRHELGQLVEAVSERHQHGQFGGVRVEREADRPLAAAVVGGRQGTQRQKHHHQQGGRQTRDQTLAARVSTECTHFDCSRCCFRRVHPAELTAIIYFV